MEDVLHQICHHDPLQIYQIDTGLPLCPGDKRDCHEAQSAKVGIHASGHRPLHLREILVEERLVSELALPSKRDVYVVELVHGERHPVLCPWYTSLATLHQILEDRSGGDFTASRLLVVHHLLHGLLQRLHCQNSRTVRPFRRAVR